MVVAKVVLFGIYLLVFVDRFFSFPNLTPLFSSFDLGAVDFDMDFAQFLRTSPSTS